MKTRNWRVETLGLEYNYVFVQLTCINFADLFRPFQNLLIYLGRLLNAACLAVTLELNGNIEQRYTVCSVF